MPLLPVRTLSNTDGEHLADHNQIHPKLNDWPNVVRDYGCVGDDSTNNTANLQAAITAVGNAAAIRGRGGTLVFPPGIYRTDQLTMLPGVRLLGLGHPSGFGNAQYGSWLSARANGQRVLFFDAGGSVRQEGFALENMGISNASFTGVTGCAIYGMNRWRITNCVIGSGNGSTPMATGLYLTDRNFADTAYLDMAWWSVKDTEFRGCSIGANIAGTGGEIMSSHFVPHGVQTNEIGLLLRANATEGSQSTEVVGCMFDQSNSGSFGAVVQGSDCGISWCKFEGGGTSETGAGIKVEPGPSVPVARYPSRNNLVGNHFTQHQGTGGAGIKVLANAAHTGIFFNHFTSCTADIVNNGTATQDFHNRKSNAVWT